MNRHKNLIMIALAALVAGAAALVYAEDGKKVAAPELKPAAGAAASGGESQAEGPGSPSVPARDAGAQDAEAPKVLYDLAALPEPVQRTLTEIIFAAESGDLKAMQPVIELREIRPMVAASFIRDPVAYWKEQSVDGTGRDILAAMLNILASGYVLTGEGRDATYVWPYFADMDLKTLTPAQQVEFYRTVPPAVGAEMKKSGKYSYYRFGISPAGVWHYFIQ